MAETTMLFLCFSATDDSIFNEQNQNVIHIALMFIKFNKLFVLTVINHFFLLLAFEPKSIMRHLVDLFDKVLLASFI